MVKETREGTWRRNKEKDMQPLQLSRNKLGGKARVEMVENFLRMAYIVQRVSGIDIGNRNIFS